MNQRAYADATDSEAVGGLLAGVRAEVEELERLLLELEEEMHQAAKDLRFEYAARLRDEVVDLRKELKSLRAAGVGA
jgi:excinuclease ABC subunit B